MIFSLALLLSGNANTPLDRIMAGLQSAHDTHEPSLAEINNFQSAMGVVYCGNGMYVDGAGAVMDYKVEAIQGSWEDGCKICGEYLQQHGLTCSGWYCRKGYAFGIATGIWLRRDSGAGICNVNGAALVGAAELQTPLATLPLAALESAPVTHTLEEIETLEAALGVTYCGNGMYVSGAGAVMDSQVMAIQGSWEQGCDVCGKYLEAHKITCAGWYCKKGYAGPFATGIWLIRDSGASICNTNQLQLGTVEPEEDERVYLRAYNIENVGCEEYPGWCDKEETNPMIAPTVAQVETLESALGVTYCGNGMYVSGAGAVMDSQVMAIQGSWEAGCNICGTYLQQHGKTCAGWYCKKGYAGPFATGIWLRRDSGAGICNL